MAAAALLADKPQADRRRHRRRHERRAVPLRHLPRIRRAISPRRARRTGGHRLFRRRCRRRTRGVALDDFIRVHSDDSITLVINHSEMGQGALSNLAVLVAEEMELPLARVRTEFAPADKRYRNPLWGQQFTGGSSSVRGEWQPLRRHAAGARERLRSVAGLAAGTCRPAIVAPRMARSCIRRANAGWIRVAGGSGRAPRSRRLRSHSSLRASSGSSAGPQPRLDIPDMATGRTGYGIDVTRPGLRVASVARCPHPGGRGDARRQPGRTGAARVCTRWWKFPAASPWWPVTSGRRSAGARRCRSTGTPRPHGALDNALIESTLRAALADTGKRVRDDGDARARTPAGVAGAGGGLLYALSGACHARADELHGRGTRRRLPAVGRHPVAG
ncbi:MAG: molybdopterin-dependent oxidoreductase [Desulfobacterales bacterium]|nr:molybdopterin-dependent oxidoreductase [Desulfobacterales bacterium]